MFLAELSPDGGGGRPIERACSECGGGGTEQHVGNKVYAGFDPDKV
jgi:hypothetical protein